MIEIKTCSVEDIFAVFSACKGDPKSLILDVRPQKDFSKQHIVHAFSVRLSANGAVLLDYSKSAYDHQNWSDACWWDRHCIIYGPPGLKKDHPVAAFLSQDGHAASVAIYKEGFETFAAQFPFLATAGVRTNRDKEYPSMLEPGLFLGNWGHAEAVDRLAELRVRNILSIHNNPERLKIAPGTKHMQIQLADVDSEDIATWLLPAHEFIDSSRKAGKAVLVHCGAGVSRSAALCIGHLMRRHTWTAAKALEHVKSRRSIVQPNDGFWQALCELEVTIGLNKRSDASLFQGVHGRDSVQGTVAGDTTTDNGAAKAIFVPLADERPPAKHDSEREGRVGREIDRRCERSRDYRRRRSSSRSRSPCEQRRRSYSRERGGGRGEHRRSHSRSRSRGRRDHRDVPHINIHFEAARVSKNSLEGTGSSSSVALDVFYKDGEKIGSLVLDVSRSGQEYFFGRLPSCSVVLDHLSISRQHAKMTTDGAGGLFITDLGSAHGTNVDGAWVRAHIPRRLEVGSALRFGASSREYRVTKLPKGGG